MSEEWPHHAGRPSRFPNLGQLISMGNKTAALKRYPLTRVSGGLIGKPLHFLAPLIYGRLRFSALGSTLILDGQDNGVMFRQRKRLERTEYALLVNGFDLTRHNTSIVTAPATPRLVPLASLDRSRLDSSMRSDAQYSGKNGLVARETINYLLHVLTMFSKAKFSPTRTVVHHTFAVPRMLTGFLSCCF